MVFSSSIFVLAFLPIFLCAYFIAERIKSVAVKNWVILLFSLLFYAWGGLSYLLIVILLVAVNYCLVLLIHKYEKYRKFFFLLCIFIDLGNLAFWKYFNFLIENIFSVLCFFGLQHQVPEIAKIALPIGISFYTFQIMSYVIDVYNKKVEPQGNFGHLLMYVIMFPQLIAGPIVRYSDVNERILIRNSTVTNVKAGIKRFVVGFAKKIFLANTVASFADVAFAQWSIMHPLYLWFGAICYSLQIFYDFSAYSDMAIGLGRIIGFDFCENFDSPYISMSMKEFWRRWHISLSQWFRDYVYIPLGGNRRGKVRTCINLVAVFFLTGLWHGAAWQFVFWGLWNGLFLLLERTKFGTFLEKIPKFFRHLYCLVVVLLGWIMFRADSLNNAVGYVKNMFLGNIKSFYNIEALKCMTPFNFFMFLISIIGIIPIFKKVMLKSVESSSVFSEVGYLLLYGLTIIYMSGISYNPFIYFQF